MNHICIVHYDGTPADETFVQILELNDPLSRYRSLSDVVKLRSSQPLDSKHRLEDVCSHFVNSFENITPNHGYHRSCYNRFTKNIQRLQVHDGADDGDGGPSTKKIRHDYPSRSSIGSCVFCGSEKPRNIKVRGIWTKEELLTTNHGHGGGDLLNISYHRSCQRNYKD